MQMFYVISRLAIR